MPFLASLRQDLGWWRRGWRRERLGVSGDPLEWEALAAYRGLTHQAFRHRPFRPEVSADLWVKRSFRSAKGLKPFFSPAARERDNASHHYGHDIQLKRHAGLPLVGRPLPFLLEHGLKVSREASFEAPRPWVRGYLCMGPLRAQWLRERHGLPAHAIGPWIHYAQPLLAAEELAGLRDSLGPLLLVVLAHSWDQVERRMDLEACLQAVQRLQADHGYRQVIWLRHWQDPAVLPLPPAWIVACNGHRSNPWFLDGLRTLLELSDGLASNAFGTHLGYGALLGKRLHWFEAAAEEDRSRLTAQQAAREAIEWRERQRLSRELQQLLQNDTGRSSPSPALHALLDPYWGLERTHSGEELARLLRGRPDR